MAATTTVTVFSSDALRILSNVVTVLGVSTCAFCLARRTAGEDFFSSRGRANITHAKWCLLLVFVDSWIFMALSGLLINGVGLSVSTQACELAIISCIAFYAASKCLIYAFLIEKVYIVWSAGSSLRRFQTPVYRVCAIALGAYSAVIVLMVLFRFSQLSASDGRCVIGLKRTASIALLSYDLFVNVCLTALFLLPLARTTKANARLRRVTLRTLIAAAAALTTSTVNIVILAICDGREVGWVCLASCGADVTVNAIVLYWVTEPPSASGVGPDTVPRLKTIEDDEQKGPVVTLPAAARRPRPYPHTPSLPSSGWDSELDTAHTASTESMRFAPPPSGRAPPFSSTARLVISIPQLRAPDPVSSPASQSSASPASFTLKRTRSGGLVRAPPSPAAVHRPAAGGRTFSWSPGALSPAPERHFPRAAPAPLTESKWSRALWFGPSAPPRRPRPVRLAALASLPESYPLHRHSLTLPRDPDPDPQLARTHSLPLA